MKFVAIKKLEEVKRLVKSLMEKKTLFSLDLETTGTDPRRDEIVGVGLCWDKRGAVYIPLQHKYDQPFDGDKALGILKPLLSEYPFMTFNILFDLEFLEYSAGISHSGEYFDVALLSYVNGRYTINSLKVVAEKECPEVYVGSYSDFMKDHGLSPNKNTIAEASIKDVADYCGRDALAAFLIYNSLYPKLQNNKIYKLEAALLPVTAWLRANGVQIDKDFFEREGKALGEELESLKGLIEAQMSEAAGTPIHFNIGSPKQLGEVLSEALSISFGDYTPTGLPKTDIGVLSKLQWKYPIVRNIITYKEVQKRLTTYYRKYLSHVQADGRIHASYNQTGVVTGRYSCSDPNLQNIPKEASWKVYSKDQISRKIHSNARIGFTVSKDSWFVEFDYNQIEARAAAGVTQEPVLLNAFREKIDYHIKTASLVFGVPIKNVTKVQRKLGKTLNYALAYGMGTNLLYHKLRKEMDISYDQAKIFRQKYLDSYPQMFHDAEMIARAAERTHSVDTVFGRRIPIFLFEDKGTVQDAKRMAYSCMVQGSAADIVKLQMVKAYRMIKEKYNLEGVKLILMTHDALAFEVSQKLNLIEFITKTKEVLNYQLKGFPSFFVNFGVGENWGSLKEPKQGESISDFVNRLQGQQKPSKATTRKRCFVLEFPSEGTIRTQAVLEEVRDFFLSRPGVNEIIFKMGEKEKSFPHTTSVGIEEREQIMLIAQAKFYERVKEKKNGKM